MIELTRRRDRSMVILLCALLFAATEAEASAQVERADDPPPHDGRTAARPAEGLGHALRADRVEGVVDTMLAQDAELAASHPAAERAAMARALFGEGLAHARRARFIAAADFFERAHALRPAPAIAYNLASALAQIGRLIEASELLQWVIRHPDTEAEMRVAAERTIEQVTPRLASVRLVVSGSNEGVDLLFDGAPLAYAAVGVDVPLDPGPHRFEAMRGETRVAYREIELPEGARERVELLVAPPPAPPPARVIAVAPPADDPPSEDLAWLGWSGAVLGVAIVAAVITTVLVLDEQGAIAQPIPGTTMPRILEWR